MPNLVRRHIADHGLHVTHVLADRVQPGWTYTVGLWGGHGHPEIVTSGLPPRTAHGILNTIRRRVAAGERFDHGVVDPRRLTNGRLAFLALRDTRGEHLLDASAHYGGKRFEAVQMVWPDPNGLFPWEQGHSPFPPQELLYDRRRLEIEPPGLVDRPNRGLARRRRRRRAAR